MVHAREIDLSSALLDGYLGEPIHNDGEIAVGVRVRYGRSVTIKNARIR